MKPKLKARPISWAVVAPGAPIFDEEGYTVSIEDESAGEFVRIMDHSDSAMKGMAIEPADWPVLRDAIAHAVSLCRRQDDEVMKEAKP